MMSPLLHTIAVSEPQKSKQAAKMENTCNRALFSIYFVIIGAPTINTLDYSKPKNGPKRQSGDNATALPPVSAPRGTFPNRLSGLFCDPPGARMRGGRKWGLYMAVRSLSLRKKNRIVGKRCCEPPQPFLHKTAFNVLCMLKAVLLFSPSSSAPLSSVSTSSHSTSNLRVFASGALRKDSSQKRVCSGAKSLSGFVCARTIISALSASSRSPVSATEAGKHSEADIHFFV